MTAVGTGRTAIARDLLASGASVGLSRSVVSSFLRANELGAYEERALAIVSELVTNAVAISGPTDVVRVYVAADTCRVRVAVSDTAPERDPAPRGAVSSVEEIDDAGYEEFGGWGLMLVEAYADQVWTERPAGVGFKWVCAAIDLQDAR